MNMRTHRNGFRRMAGLGLLLAVVGLAGCDLDDILDVEDRDTVNPGTLEDPEVINVVINGAIGDFVDAFDGDQDSYTTVTGLMADEFFSSGTFTTRTATDRRDQFTAANGNTSDRTYVELQSARRALKDAAAKVAAHEDFGTGSAAYAELKALEGYTIFFLGEAWCSSVPLSNVVDGQFVFGTALTSSQLFDTAQARFTASNTANANHLAAVGLGRARLAKGDFAGAAAAVAGVPTTWEYRIFHSESGISNPMFSAQSNGRFSQSDREGGNDTGAPFREPEDPRAPWTDDGVGFDPGIPLYVSNKYNDYSDPTILASGVEARLIEAEADLQAGNFGAMTTKLNALRADVAAIMADWVPGYDAFVDDATLADLATPGDPATARQMLFEERAFWLFLTGHRLGDLRRLVYQYGLPQVQVYPSGDYHKGGSYGDDVVFQIDFDESNNENYDLATCDVNSAAIN